MRKKFLIPGSILIILPFWYAFSQPVKLNAILDRDSIMIGAQTQLSLQVIKSPDAQVIFPLLQDTVTSEIEVIQRKEVEITGTGSEVIMSGNYLITSFDTGYHVIPPLPFPIDVDGEKDTLYTHPLFLYVGMPEVDLQANFRDIVPPVNTPFILKEIIPYAGIGLAGLAVLALALYVLFRFFRNKKNDIEEKHQVPAYLIALDELKKLHLEKAWENQTVKDFYTRLSAIVRTYLEEQFDVPAMESTTSEILPVFREAYGDNSEIIPLLEELLHLSDLVKFAKETPLAATNMKNINKAIQFVELTKPEETEFKE
jgi:hypothetical protein